MENLLKDTVIQLLGIIIGGCLAVASAYASLLIARATQKIKRRRYSVRFWIAT